jgi:hypothetical protein
MKIKKGSFKGSFDSLLVHLERIKDRVKGESISLARSLMQKACELSQFQKLFQVFNSSARLKGLVGELKARWEKTAQQTMLWFELKPVRPSEDCARYKELLRNVPVGDHTFFRILAVFREKSWSVPPFCLPIGPIA